MRYRKQRRKSLNFFIDACGAWVDRYHREVSGQLFVEMAVVLPVVIAVGLILFNLASFLNYCVAFDRAAASAVLAQGVAPQGIQQDENACSQVEENLKEVFSDAERIEVSVSLDSEAFTDNLLSLAINNHLTVYRCTMKMRIWPSALSFAGVSLVPPAQLIHTKTLAVDRFKAGVVA